MVCSEEKGKIIRSFLKSVFIRTSVFLRACLIYSKDCLASTIHLCVESFFNMLFNSLISSSKLEMNLLRKVILPKNACNYLMFLG